MLVSLILLAYNQEEFVLEAVQGALSQDYSPLEVILSDDSSTDRTFEIMEEVVAAYRGEHLLRLRRTRHNEGLIGHLNQVMGLVSGRLVVVAAGDDISLPGRVAAIVSAYSASNSQSLSLYSNAHVIDRRGHPERRFYTQPPFNGRMSLECAVRSGTRVLGATHAWDVRVFSVFGPLPAAVAWEDWVIPFRAGLLGSIEYVDQVLILYRKHGGNVFLGQDDYLSSKAGWFRHVGSLAQQEARIVACYRRDLATARGKALGSSARLDGLERLVDDTALRARTRCELSAHVSFRRRWAALRELFSGTDLATKEKVRWIVMFFGPGVYVIWLRHRVRRASLRS